MTDIDKVLRIVGAAEGSYYSNIDVRYTPSFAGVTSGLSFGIFQFDVHANADAKHVFESILAQGTADKSLDDKASDRLLGLAATKNAGALLQPADKAVITKLMATVASMGFIDAADRNRATTVGGLIDALIANAALKWTGKKIAVTPILTPGQADCLRLFAYLLACFNRFEANQGTFQSWLQGDLVRTAGGPPAGTQLTAPPTVDQMYAFLSSLRIWDGTQGNWDNLRARLDPVLLKIGE